MSDPIDDANFTSAMQQIASLDPNGAAFNTKYFPDSKNELAWDKFKTRFKLSYIESLRHHVIIRGAVRTFSTYLL
jgi:hypothetical protein